MKRKVAILRGMAAIMAFLLFVTVSASNLMFSYAGVINSEFNVFNEHGESLLMEKLNPEFLFQ